MTRKQRRLTMIGGSLAVLAKHDETYMPKDVADALKKQGHWKDDYGAKPGAAAAAAPVQGASK
jgi:cytochrome c-type biogenesis protein CcmE